MLISGDKAWEFRHVDGVDTVPVTAGSKTSQAFWSESERALRGLGFRTFQFHSVLLALFIWNIYIDTVHFQLYCHGSFDGFDYVFPRVFPPNPPYFREGCARAEADLRKQDKLWQVFVPEMDSRDSFWFGLKAPAAPMVSMCWDTCRAQMASDCKKSGRRGNALRFERGVQFLDSQPNVRMSCNSIRLLGLGRCS